MDTDGREKLKLDEVEWDGLLLDLVNFLSRFRLCQKIFESRWFGQVIAFDAVYNPCHSDDNESLAWRLMCYFFPGCWCCSGIRGILYGIVLTTAIFSIWRII